eukprot:Nk52_evm77s212 gene=Nk52_evmTU77s212
MEGQMYVPFIACARGRRCSPLQKRGSDRIKDGDSLPKDPSSQASLLEMTLHGLEAGIGATGEGGRQGCCRDVLKVIICPAEEACVEDSKVQEACMRENVSLGRDALNCGQLEMLNELEIEQLVEYFREQKESASVECLIVSNASNHNKKDREERKHHPAKIVWAGIRAGLVVILCVGETLEEKNAQRTNDVVESQLNDVLVNNRLTGEDKSGPGLASPLLHIPKNLMIAYTPPLAGHGEVDNGECEFEQYIPLSEQLGKDRRRQMEYTGNCNASSLSPLSYMSLLQVHEFIRAWCLFTFAPVANAGMDCQRENGGEARTKKPKVNDDMDHEGVDVKEHIEWGGPELVKVLYGGKPPMILTDPTVEKQEGQLKEEGAKIDMRATRSREDEKEVVREYYVGIAKHAGVNGILFNMDSDEGDDDDADWEKRMDWTNMVKSLSELGSEEMDKRQSREHRESKSVTMANGPASPPPSRPKPEGDLAVGGTDAGKGVESKEEQFPLLKSLLRERLRITISDGRQFTGEFVCTDRDLNIVLANCVEERRISNRKEMTENKSETDGEDTELKNVVDRLTRRLHESRLFTQAHSGSFSSPDVEQRSLGLVMVPGNHVVDIKCRSIS